MSVIKYAQKSRYDLINRLLIDEFVMIHLDPNIQGVVVPQHFKGQEMLTLKLSKLFRGKLIVEKDQIEAELLFGQEYFECTIPIAAIWGATSYQGHTQVWQDNVPTFILAQCQLVDENEAPAKAKADFPSKTAKKSTANSSSLESSSSVTRKKGHLTRVK